MRYLLIALTLTATTAWSQTALQLSLPNNETELRVSPNDCGLTRTVNWTHSIGVTPCDDLKFWIVEGSCTDEPPAGTTLVDTVSKASVPTTRSGVVTFSVDELPLFKDTDCPVEAKEVEYKLCASVPTIGSVGDCSSNSKNYQKDDVDVVYDALPPDPPTITKVAPLDGALSVRLDIPTDANRATVHIEKMDGTAGQDLTQSSGQTLFRIENLENNVTYRVTAISLDAAGNESAASEAQEGTPIHTKGFLDHYDEAKGQEMGGCGVALGSLTGGWVLVVLGFWLSSRRNRS
jgi:hypothetical protein